MEDVAIILHPEIDQERAWCVANDEFARQLTSRCSTAAGTQGLFSDETHVRKRPIRGREHVLAHVFIPKLHTGIQGPDRQRRFQLLDDETVSVLTNPRVT